MLEEYYNKETETLTLPFNFNSLLEDLPLGAKKILFFEEYCYNNTYWR